MKVFRSAYVTAGIMVFLVILCSRVYADTCDALMRFGVYDEYDSLSESSQYRLLKTMICESKFSSYAEAEKGAQNVGIGIDIFSFSFGGSNARDNWGQWSSSFCQTGYDEIKNNYTLRNKIRVISPTLMSAVKTCLETQTVGVRGWFETSKDRKLITFKASYTPIGAEKGKIEAFGFVPREAVSDCQGLDQFKKGKQLVHTPKDVMCSVDPSKTIGANLTTIQGGVSVMIEGYEKRETLPRPTIKSFAIDHEEVTRGQKVKLSWAVSEASSVSISPNIGTVNAVGQREITPQGTTRYTLTAHGVNTVTKDLTIKVNNPPPAITSFAADKAVIALGQSAKISWTTRDATSVTIDQNIGHGGASGTVTVHPDNTTAYRLVASGIGPSVEKELIISVNPKIRVYEHVDRGGASLDVKKDTIFLNDFWQKTISSMDVFTDEWVSLACWGPGLRVSVFAAKGPRYIPNFTAVKATNGNTYDINDRCWVVGAGGAQKPTGNNFIELQ